MDRRCTKTNCLKNYLVNSIRMEYIYCIENKALPDICKCGGTSKKPERRCKELSNTSLPLKCQIAYSVEVSNWKEAEKYIHNKLEELGIERYTGREWFKCKPDDIKYLFDECAKLYKCNEEIVVDDNKKSVVKSKSIKNTKIKVVKNVEAVKEYVCDLCDYITTDSGNFSKHKQTLKHIDNTNNILLIEKENEKLKSQLLEHKHKIELLEKELEILKFIYKII